MPLTNEVLEERINNMLEANGKEHANIMAELVEINNRLDGAFVTKQEFKPVKVIAYGLVGTICTGVITAILALVLS